VTDKLIFMELAIQEAKTAYEYGEVPVGAIIVYKNEILASGRNRIIELADPTAHAEIIAIRKAAKLIGNYRLINTSIFVTLEPCSMCYGAICHSRIKNIFFGAFDSNTGSCGSCLNLPKTQCFNHRPKIVGGVMEKDCSNLLLDFFKEKRR